MSDLHFEVPADNGDCHQVESDVGNDQRKIWRLSTKNMPKSSLTIVCFLTADVADYRDGEWRQNNAVSGSKHP